jgi:hypothetical protein
VDTHTPDARADFDYLGSWHTMLVDMWSRLAASARPVQIFEVTGGGQAGRVGRVQGSLHITDPNKRNVP